MTDTPTIRDIDHCRLEIVDEILGTRTVLELPTTVAEAVADCIEVLRAKFFLRWCECDEPFGIDGEPVRPEPIGVAIVQRGDCITVTWHATGLLDDAVMRRRQILRGNWVRGEVGHDD